ncbi:alpha/beta hydrolase [Telluria mixta]|uniref:Alpha/beta hydrolase n=1 Tax=Telluria mixta TaxID=34071 RepID=A0ABT2BYN4_9BURK|nr:alpha/beta hydrolase [Telluria mixta]MCS0630252.1 alpha/beta hydrolase [Telluria mixta]WEM94440.1 alpha/beta hydrolase [Telluria mixta]
MLRHVCYLLLPLALLGNPVRAAVPKVCDLPGVDLPAPAAANRAPESWGYDAQTLMVRNVSRPTLTPVLPAPGTATGAAVIVAPGGGFFGLAIDKEGCQVARWLAARGVAAFVLKYRLNATPADESQFKVELERVLRGGKASFSLPEDTPPEAAADGLAALRHVRRHAGQYGIDAARVGFMGFSAGGFLTRTLVARGGEDVPAFAAPIYPNMEPLVVPGNAPPMFVAIGQQDFLLKGARLPLVESYLAAGKPIELHLFSDDEHGFGMGIKDKTSDGWLDTFYHWLAMRGLLAQARPASR